MCMKYYSEIIYYFSLFILFESESVLANVGTLDTHVSWIKWEQKMTVKWRQPDILKYLI